MTMMQLQSRTNWIRILGKLTALCSGQGENPYPFVRRRNLFMFRLLLCDSSGRFNESLQSMNEEAPVTPAEGSCQGCESAASRYPSEIRTLFWHLFTSS